MQSASVPAVVRHLETVTDQHPLTRKLLVCSSMGEGRELLRALARHCGSWIGWEITTPRRMAMERVGPALAAEGLAVADSYEEQAAVDVALDGALESPKLASLQELAEAPGFRQAVVNAVEALRLAGVSPDAVGRVGGSPVRSLLAAVLTGYTDVLQSRGLVDTAHVLDRAPARLDEPAAPDPTSTYLVPGLSRRGATGRLLDALIERGARPLTSDPVLGLDVPTVVWQPSETPGPLSALAEGRLADGAELDLFAASGPAEEVREVLRRALAGGYAWDDVEIVTPDPVVYGSALHAAAERLGIPVSYAVGLPVERTRPGRVAAAYFRWIQEGYPADEIRRMLESGDLASADGPDPLRLARRLRQLRIGWGHGRYLPAIDRALEVRQTVRPRRGETETEARDRLEAERSELEALRGIVAPILEATPRLAPGDGARKVTPAELAMGLRALLERVTAADDTSATARDRLLGIADRVAATLDRPTEPAAAIALLRRHLEIRVPAPQREGAAPWVSDGGHIHLSDLEHGGYSGRPATFVVGLDADRFPGAGLQDPLLLDAQRRALDPDALPTSAARLTARRFTLAACLSRLRGRVTLSYSAWEPTEARAVAPASVMLDAYRAATGRPDASFEDLTIGLGDAASAIPRGAALDEADLWFRALEQNGILRSGTHAVRSAYPGLDAGLEAGMALAGDVATSYHGLIEPRDALDPRRDPETVLSASGLEDLGTCGLRYFYKYGLGVRKPDDPELDPDVWLDAMSRGRLLHTVYEKVLSEARESGISAGDEAFTALALDRLDREARAIAREVPPPGEAVRRRELRELRADVRSFAHMLEGRDDRWRALELRFGFAGEPPVPMKLKGGEIRLRGAIDRVDEAPDGLTVIDYKTGSTSHYERRHGTFHGGRRLQNLVYSVVAEQIMEARVARMEYHFPTRRGRNEVIEYRREELDRGRGLVDRLLDGVAAGRFLPTEDPGDCRFCDYQPICRHSTDGWQRAWETPRADWAARHFETLPEYRERREARAWEATFLAELEGHGEAS